MKFLITRITEKMRIKKLVPILPDFHESIRLAAQQNFPNPEKVLFGEMEDTDYPGIQKGAFCLIEPGCDIILIEDYWHTEKQGRKKIEQGLML